MQRKYTPKPQGGRTPYKGQPRPQKTYGRPMPSSKPAASFSEPQESWGGVATWYNNHLEDGDSYHTQVLLPNIMRVLQLSKGERVLDLACGQGFFSRACSDAGAEVMGADIAPELIALAKEESPSGISYFVSAADKLVFADDHEFDTVLCVLAIQNMKDMSAVVTEVKRVLKPGGRFVLVINHPTFRIPKSTSWGWDDYARVQYRRVDKYLTPSSVSIDMHPGKKNSEKTVSFHRSLQDFFKTFSREGLAVTKLEEWISHRSSEKGPRQKAEDTSRKEIPLFLMLEAKVI